ncbi:LysR family transcriptional regulator [Dubosiella newyorkensis]
MSFRCAKASSRLYISQPALSSSVHELEEELGFLLFGRTRIKESL